MAATSHSAAFKKVKRAFTSSPHWEALSAEYAKLFGRNKSFTKSFGAQAASRGHPMASHWRFLTGHPVTNLLLLFFYYRSIRWRFADLLRHCLRTVLPILHFPPMAKHWRSPEFRKHSS